jgi:ankyrin repeat protein
MAAPTDQDRLAEAVLAAIRSDDPPALSRLLESGASTKARWKYSGEPSSWAIPIHLAASTGSAECVRVLLRHGASPNERDANGKTPLFGARTAEVVRLLAEAGANLVATDQGGMDALQSLLLGLRSPAEEQDAAIRYACTELLQGGVPLVTAAGWAGRLHLAAFWPSLPAVKFLLEAGHPIDAQAGTTALHAICWHYDCSREPHGTTSQIIRLFLQAGLGPNERDEQGRTPLHESVSGDGINLVAIDELTAAGADVNAQDDDGQTPLHLFYESQFDYDRVVPVLLNQGADPNVRDKWGRSVIDIARRMAAGENPKWRLDMFEGQGGPPCGWKAPAEPGDMEYQMIELMERAPKSGSE